MAKHSTIEWTDATWNPITGCSVVSPGCTNCYAMKLAGTRLRNHPSRAGLTTMSKAGPVWNGQVRFNQDWLLQPLQWKTPRRIFVCAHGDLFADGVPDAWIDRVFAVMALAPQHMFQVLTKRSKRMREYLLAINDEFHGSPDNLNERFGEHCVQLSGDPCAAGWFEDEVNWPLPNVHLGVSTEDQQRADERIPDLLATPAAVRFISAEPLLGRIDLCETFGMWWNQTARAFESSGSVGFNRNPNNHAATAIDWVIVGGESGRGGRPMHPDWVRALRDQCAAAGVPFFFKQWGEWLPGETNYGQFDPSPLNAYRRCDNHNYDWPPGNFARTNFGSHADPFSGDWSAQRVGKSAAGRLLDGVEHNGMPEVRRG